MPFDEWVKWALDYPGLSHDGYFVAMCGEDHVGLGEFTRKPDTDILQAGLSGVGRAFRRMGIALAIQVRAIAFARQSGYTCIETSTSITNMPMRNLYARLGFVRQPD
jgi:RimJ/RimL family protein N-acetyltransferase